MGKDTYFIGQPVYVQLLNLVDRERIRKISFHGGYDRYVKKLDGHTHFVAFLFAVLMRLDTLRETVIGMMAEANKLQHLGVDYLVKRSTLSDANNRRSSLFFRDIYRHLYNRYRHILSDSRLSEVQKRLYVVDSTTITMFSTILKGAGRKPRHGKKKGGIKAHCVIRYDEWAPHFFKQLKQNSPLKYFYGESVNAIESQIWVCLIANLLLTVVNRKVKRRWAFSNLVTAVRQMLMYYVDIFRFLENPERTWERINAGRCKADIGQLELQF